MKKLTTLIPALLLLALFATPCSAAKQKVIEMNMTHCYMEKHSVIQGALIPWIKEIEKRTDGRVKIHYYTPNTLCPDSEVFDSIVSGAVDLGGHLIGRNPGKFPYTSAFDEPLIAPGSAAASPALFEFITENDWVAQEFSEVKFLTIWSSVAFQVHTKKPVRTLEDLKGMKIAISGSGTLNLTKGLGANPVMLSYSEMYLALERGMAEGFIGPLAQMRTYRLNEPLKYTTVANLRVSPLYLVMNKKLWDSLPADIQQIFEETSGMALALKAGEALDLGTYDDGKWMQANGHTFIKLSDEEAARWQAAAKPAWEVWLKDMEAKGNTRAKETLDLAIKLGAKWAKEVSLRGYEGE
ncbi:TRAP transporter substrate-binding protein [Desulfovibrio sp. OttesenSCG-928-C06]|nr:TRAP transporter substrate-binding protein [Desulfovibrio sp. OttesenSCG-928-C06]